MFNLGCNPVIKGCVFVSNSAETSGGAMVNLSAFPLIANCIMTTNVARTGIGGGMANSTLGPPVIDSTFCGNLPDQLSGGPITDGGGNIISDICPPPTALIASGACCVDGNCLTLSATDCALVGGTYQGDDTDCASVICPAACPADINGDGVTNVPDLLALLAAWGVCP